MVSLASAPCLGVGIRQRPLKGEPYEDKDNDSDSSARIAFCPPCLCCVSCRVVRAGGCAAGFGNDWKVIKYPTMSCFLPLRGRQETSHHLGYVDEMLKWWGVVKGVQYAENHSGQTMGEQKMARHLTLSILLAMAGCASQQMVDEQLALCPKYFQENTGEAYVLPFYSAAVPILGGPVGWMNKSDPNGSYTLTSLADKDVVLHEAFHSFDYRCALNRKEEWKGFVNDFSQGNPKPDLLAYLSCITIPIVQHIPVPGHVRLYGCSTGAEDAADCFVFWVRGRKRNDPELMRKVKAAGNFASGEYTHPWKERRPYGKKQGL